MATSGSPETKRQAWASVEGVASTNRKSDDDAQYAAPHHHDSLVRLEEEDAVGSFRFCIIQSKYSRGLQSKKNIFCFQVLGISDYTTKNSREASSSFYRGADEGRGGQVCRVLDRPIHFMRVTMEPEISELFSDINKWARLDSPVVSLPHHLLYPLFLSMGRAGRFHWLKDHPCFGPLGRRSRRYTPNSGEVSMLSDCTRRLRLYATGGAVVGGATCWGAIKVLAARAPMNRMQRWIWTLSGSLIGMGMATSVAGTHSMKQLVSTPNSPLADVARKL
jgi:hypothetical protein